MPRHKRGFSYDKEYPGRRRRRSLTNSLIEPALLKLIKEKARHGYGLLSSLEELGIKPVHPSIVYRTLRQMESLGFVQTEWDVDNVQGPPRKLFSLTEDGLAACEAWLDELVDAQKILRILIDQKSA